MERSDVKYYLHPYMLLFKPSYAAAVKRRLGLIRCCSPVLANCAPTLLMNLAASCTRYALLHSADLGEGVATGTCLTQSDNSQPMPRAISNRFPGRKRYSSVWTT